jgi:hypothetical protein
VKSQTSFVRTDSAIHFDPVTAINLDVAMVILPGNAEYYHTLWFYDSFNDPEVAIFGKGVENWA